MTENDFDSLFREYLYNVSLIYNHSDNSVEMWFNGNLITWCSIPVKDE